MAKDCSTCEHVIFCPTWGDYKCMKRRLRVKNISDGDSCSVYKKRSSEDKKCQCEDCLNYDFEE